MNLLNYFTTIDTTSSTNTAPAARRDAGLPRRRQRGRAEPPARAGLDRDLRPERRRLRLHGAREHHRHATPSPTCSARSTRAAAAPHPYAFVEHRRHARHRRHPRRADLPHRRSCRRSARRWSTSIRSTTGRPPRRRSTSSMRRTRRSASASPSIANHFKSKGCPGAPAPTPTPATARAASTPRGPPRPTACSPGSTAPCCRRPAIRTCCCSATSTPTPQEDPVTTLDGRRLHRPRDRAARPGRVLLPVRRPARPPRLRLLQRQPDPAGHRRRRLAHQRRRGAAVRLQRRGQRRPARRPSRRSPTARRWCRRASCSSRRRPTGPRTTTRCSSACSGSRTWRHREADRPIRPRGLSSPTRSRSRTTAPTPPPISASVSR